MRPGIPGTYAPLSEFTLAFNEAQAMRPGIHPDALGSRDGGLALK